MTIISVRWGTARDSQMLDLFARQLCLKQPSHNMEVGCPKVLLWPAEPQSETACAVWTNLDRAGPAPRHSKWSGGPGILGEIQLITAEPGKRLSKVTHCAEPAACQWENRRESFGALPHPVPTLTSSSILISHWLIRNTSSITCYLWKENSL